MNNGINSRGHKADDLTSAYRGHSQEVRDDKAEEPRRGSSSPSNRGMAGKKFER